MEGIIETERLLLRVFEETDLYDVMDIWGDEEVMKHCNGAIPQEQLHKALTAYASCHRINGISVYAVIEKKSGRVVGTAGFKVTKTKDVVELIYHFAKSAWGKGYATEATSACVQFAKTIPWLMKIFASADSKNAGSLKVLEKAGFEYRGMKWFEDTNQEEPYFELIICKRCDSNDKMDSNND